MVRSVDGNGLPLLETASYTPAQRPAAAPVAAEPQLAPATKVATVTSSLLGGLTPPRGRSPVRGGERRPEAAIEPTDAPASRVLALETRIASITAGLTEPANQIPKLEVGQGIVRVEGGQRQVEHRITKVEGHKVTLASFLGGGEVTMDLGDLSKELLDPARHLEVHPDASTTSPRVASQAELLYADLGSTVQALAVEETRGEIGDSRYETFSRLMARHRELMSEMTATTAELRGWIEEHGGWSSMSRMVLASGTLSWSEFKAHAKDPEWLKQAPQRAKLARLEHAVEAVKDAIQLVVARQPMANAVDVSADPVLAALVSQEVSGSKAPDPKVELSARMALLEQSVEAGDVGDGWAAYHGVIQPYLAREVDGLGSFHAGADHKPSLTLAINLLIQRKTLGDRRLITSSAELAALKTQIVAHWGEVSGELDKLRGDSTLARRGFVEPFDAAAFDREALRLAQLEQRQELRDLSGVVDRSRLDAALAKLKAAEPGFIQRFGEGTLRVLDSPQTWAMIAVGAATAGVGSTLLLGEAAVGAAKIATLVRAGTLSWRAAGLFGVSTAIDGAAFHAGMNGFNLMIGEDKLVDWSPGAFLRSMAMMGVSQSAEVGKALLAARASPGLMRAVGVPAAHFAGEASALAGVSMVEALLTQGKLDDAWGLIEQNAQFMLAMRAMHKARSAVASKVLGTPAGRVDFDELEAKFRDAERAYRHAPTKEKLVAAFAAQREYAARLQAANQTLFDQRLASRPQVALDTKTRVVTRAELEELIRSAGKDAATRAKTKHQAAGVKALHEALASDAGAFFDPVTGRSYIEERAFAGPEGAALVREQLTRQKLHALTPEARAGALQAITDHPNWPQLRLAFTRAKLGRLDMERLEMAEEMLVRAHGRGVGPSIDRLLAPALSAQPVVDAGLSTRPGLAAVKTKDPDVIATGRYSPASGAPDVVVTPVEPEPPPPTRLGPTMYVRTAAGGVVEKPLESGEPAPSIGAWRAVTAAEVESRLQGAAAGRKQALADLDKAPATAPGTDDLTAVRAGQIAYMVVGSELDARFAVDMARIGRREGFRVMVQADDEGAALLSKAPTDARENIDVVTTPFVDSAWTEDFVAFSRGQRGVASVPARIEDPVLMVRAVLLERVRRLRPDLSAQELREAEGLPSYELARRYPEVDFGVGGAVERGEHHKAAAALATALDLELRLGLGPTEGGNKVRGTMPTGEPYVCVGKDTIFLAQTILSRDAGREVSRDEAIRALAKDFGVAPEHLHPVEQPSSFHLDMAILPTAPGVVVVNDSVAAAELTAARVRAAYAAEGAAMKSAHAAAPNGRAPLPTPRVDPAPGASIPDALDRVVADVVARRDRRQHERARADIERDLADLMTKARLAKRHEDAAVRDLEAAGLTVHRMAGRFFKPDEQSEEKMNFLNVEQGIGADGKPFVVAVGGAPWAEEMAANRFLTEPHLGIERFYLTDPGGAATFALCGGIGCRVKWMDRPVEGSRGDPAASATGSPPLTSPGRGRR